MNILKILLLGLWLQTGCWANFEPLLLSSKGGHLRIDITWDEQKDCVYEIQRAVPGSDHFSSLAETWLLVSRYSDFIGENGKEYEYRVRAHKISAAQVAALDTSTWSKPVKCTSQLQNKEDLISDLQRANFEYLWSYAHPVSGLIREGSQKYSDSAHVFWERRCTTMGATGMAFFNIAVGVERNWIQRGQASERALKILRFLHEKTTRYHGAWAHWVDGATGETIPFDTYDDGADLVETAFLAQGFIFAREYFNLENHEEQEIRRLAHQLWSEIDWKFFSNGNAQNPFMFWHWSPKHGFKINLPIRGATECHIVHLLALVSPKHNIGLEYYKNSWVNPSYRKNNFFTGQDLSLGLKYGGPLFFAHYSYLGLDPRLIYYRDKTYFDHYQNICKAQYAYEKRARPTISRYQIWGLTASLDPWGYNVHAPGLLDNGTITPTASLSSWPYAPDLALESFLGMYEERGKSLWREFSFVDAYNDKKNWVAPGYISIDVATIAPMIENSRTGLCWDIFSKSKEVLRMLSIINDEQF